MEGWTQVPDTTFQHTAARRRLIWVQNLNHPLVQFQHTAARRRLMPVGALLFESFAGFQHTAARRRLTMERRYIIMALRVSTHSRPKAADGLQLPARRPKHSFNTQPPEGG